MSICKLVNLLPASFASKKERERFSGRGRGMAVHRGYGREYDYAHEPAALVLDPVRMVGSLR